MHISRASAKLHRVKSIVAKFVGMLEAKTWRSHANVVTRLAPLSRKSGGGPRIAFSGKAGDEVVGLISGEYGDRREVHLVFATWKMGNVRSVRGFPPRRMSVLYF